MEPPTSQNRSRGSRRNWAGPIIVILCGAIGLASFGGLALYRIANGWSSPIVDVDRDVIVAIQDIEPLFDELPVRLDQESWTKTWRPGERCEIRYAYDHPDVNHPLKLRSYAYRYPNRQESFKQYQAIGKKLLDEFKASLPQATYMVRDKELPIDDQSQFGSFNVEDRPIAYFFARRRGRNVYFGFIQSDEIDDGLLGAVFAPPIDHLEEWKPSP